MKGGEATKSKRERERETGQEKSNGKSDSKGTMIPFIYVRFCECYVCAINFNVATGKKSRQREIFAL